MQNAILEKVKKAQQRKVAKFSVGDKVCISVRLKEGEKERTQMFRGVVISKSPKSGKGPEATFTVRKVSGGIGVERIFPLHSPFVEKIQVESSSGVRQSRLYFLRDLKGKKARLKEKGRFEELVIPVEDQVAPEQTGQPQAEAQAASAEPVSGSDKDAESKIEVGNADHKTADKK